MGSIEKLSRFQKWRDDGSTTAEFPDLYLASRLTMMRHIERIKSLLPKTHQVRESFLTVFSHRTILPTRLIRAQVYLPAKREATMKERQYGERMDEVFSDGEFVDSMQRLMPAVEQYALSALKMNRKVDLSSIVHRDSYKDLISFATLCVEVSGKRNFAIFGERFYRRIYAIVVGALVDRK